MVLSKESIEKQVQNAEPSPRPTLDFFIQRMIASSAEQANPSSL